MHTESAILISGDPGRIFQLAADIQDWPQILPHYRYVVLEERWETGKTARMGASRDGIPVYWRAYQELRPAERRILFRHIGGFTRGMEVEWRIEPGSPSNSVTITHDFRCRAPLVGSLFAHYIVGKFFIENIAGKTLRCIKQIVEAESAAELS